MGCLAQFSSGHEWPCMGIERWSHDVPCASEASYPALHVVGQCQTRIQQRSPKCCPSMAMQAQKRVLLCQSVHHQSLLMQQQPGILRQPLRVPPSLHTQVDIPTAERCHVRHADQWSNDITIMIHYNVAFLHVQLHPSMGNRKVGC